MKLEHCKLGKVAKIGGKPPICVIPKLSKAGDLPEPVLVSIKLVYGIKENYTKFASGMAEEALHHVILC